MARHVIATVDEIPPGQRKLVEVAGRSIGIFNVGGEFFALRNLCPHKQGPLCTGFVSGRMLAAAPPSSLDEGGLEWADEGEIIRCPWHLWEFEIRTGRCLVDASVRVKTYPVTVRDGEVIVQVED